jgi:hypothetical protein
MSLDEALSAFSEVLMGGEPDTAADQLDMLSALVAQLRESQGQLHDTRGQLRESRG